MKFPSLIRLPKHQRFQFKPRHYDPVREEIEERVSRIKTEIKANETSSELPDNGSSAISGSFRAKSKTTKKVSASGLQLIIALFLMVTVFGWLYYGNSIFYSYILVLPVIVWVRSKNILAAMSSFFSSLAFVGFYLWDWEFPFLQEFIVLTLLMTGYFWFRAKRMN